MEWLDRLFDSARNYAVFTDYFSEIESYISKALNVITAQNWGGFARRVAKG